jgi:hypothetical protein
MRQDRRQAGENADLHAAAVTAKLADSSEAVRCSSRFVVFLVPLQPLRSIIITAEARLLAFAAIIWILMNHEASGS